ncbi:CA216 protein, partial [Turnix velox]|nr:CA216 protein [Turnix velox]
MFAVCPPAVPANSPFGQGPGGVPVPVPGGGCGQDSNSNFVGDVVCDSNENWSHPSPGSSPQQESSSRSENPANPSHNLLLLMQRQMVQGQLRDTPPSLGAEPGVRSPPEGAEVGGTGTQIANPEGCPKPPGSPAEDNGYASSSLSIDSPDSAC